jgi:xanthine/uracil permease
MRRRVISVLAIGATLAGVDLATKAIFTTEPSHFDPRTHTWVLLSAAVLCGSILLALLPSRAVVGAAALVAGGVTGNLVSAARNDGSVQNPFFVSGMDRGIAFNLADILVMVGIAAQTVALMSLTIRYRHVLPRSFVATRILRRIQARRRRR